MSARVSLVCVGLFLIFMDMGLARAESNTRSVDHFLKGEEFSIGKAMKIAYGNVQQDNSSLFDTTILSETGLFFARHHKTDRFLANPAKWHETNSIQGKRIYVVVSSVPADGDYSCHFCFPLIGLIVFEMNESRWNLKTFHPDIAVTGRYGTAPESSILKLGRETDAVILKFCDLHFGLTTDYMIALAYMGNSPELVFSETTFEDSMSTYQCEKEEGECVLFKRDIFIGQTDDHFFPLKVVETRALDIRNDSESIIKTLKTVTYYEFDKTSNTYKPSSNNFESIAFTPLHLGGELEIK